MEFSPDGGLVATGGYDGMARVWDPATWHPVRVLSGHTDWVRSVAFSPNGGLLATVNSDRSVRLWEPSTGRAVTMMRADSVLTGCVWAADGGALFVSGEAGLFAYALEEGSTR
ncbi:hypothetical protein [Streptomyces sp. NPDC087859]|uniref:hypothetical protein n=1 Tax=Streptomyces sp. NPDC087859 TaxID=3365812 RepID=UPI003821135E